MSGHLLGEALRAKTNPSVTDLMLKRLTALRPGEGFDPNVSYHFTAWTVLLSRWDRKAALPFAKAQMARLQTQADKTGAPNVLSGNGLSTISQMTIARVEAGDDAALIEYSIWFVASWNDPMTKSQLDLSGTRFGESPYAPLWLYADRPAMKTLAARLLDDEKSPLRNAFKRDDIDWPNSLRTVLSSPLMSISLFKERALVGLRDKSAIGEMQASATDQWGIQTINDSYGYLKLKVGAWQNWVGIQKSVRSLPVSKSSKGKTSPDEVLLDKQARPLRVCDFYAWAIFDSRADWTVGQPAFPLDGTPQKRDDAIEKIKKWLNAYKAQRVSDSS